MLRTMYNMTQVLCILFPTIPLPICNAPLRFLISSAYKRLPIFSMHYFSYAFFNSIENTTSLLPQVYFISYLLNM